MIETIRDYGPGLALLSVIALAATVLARFVPDAIGAVFIAVVLGVIVANVFQPDPRTYDKGVRLGLKKFLKLAIVLLGAGITFQEILGFGLEALAVILVLIGFVFATTVVLSRVMGIGIRKTLLIAVGISICGNTAVATTAPLVEARDDEVAMAVGIVTLFGVLGVLAYPFIGLWLELSDLVFGMWAGTAINDTSQVVAAGFIYSEEAGTVATTIKLARNVMIVPVVVGVGYYYARNVRQSQGDDVRPTEIFPTFVLGFIALALLNSAGVIPASVADVLDDVAGFLILLALSGIGLGVRIQAFTRIGWKPFVAGFSVELLLAAVSLGLIWMVVT